MEKLLGKKIAILATDGFEESELFEPKQALEEAGADVKIISLKGGEIRAWKKENWGESIAVDLTLEDADAEDFDALLLPGGVMNPDRLRNDQKSVAFVRSFAHYEKPIAAICHGPQILIDAGVVQGRIMTSYPSIRLDLMNAGADWVDQEVVSDQGLITSRKPDDIPAFNRKMIQVFSEASSDVSQMRAANSESDFSLNF